MTDQQNNTKSRIILGTVILVTGFLTPLLIPVVLTSDLSDTYKNILTGLLAFGVPELFMLIAIAVMGKQGYEYIKGRVFRYFKRFAPPDHVNLVRFRFGLFLFWIPLLIGILHPYLSETISIFREVPLRVTVISDVVFVSSFFVLGGDFWDKLSGLFRYTDKE